MPGADIIEANGALYFLSYSGKLTSYNYDRGEITSSEIGQRLTGTNLLNYKNKVWVVEGGQRTQPEIVRHRRQHFPEL